MSGALGSESPELASSTMDVEVVNDLVQLDGDLGDDGYLSLLMKIRNRRGGDMRERIRNGISALSRLGVRKSK
jgi:hypothetical protein